MLKSFEKELDLKDSVLVQNEIYCEGEPTANEQGYNKKPKGRVKKMLITPTPIWKNK